MGHACAGMYSKQQADSVRGPPSHQERKRERFLRERHTGHPKVPQLGPHGRLHQRSARRKVPGPRQRQRGGGLPVGLPVDKTLGEAGARDLFRTPRGGLAEGGVDARLDGFHAQAWKVADEAAAEKKRGGRGKGREWKGGAGG